MKKCWQLAAIATLALSLVACGAEDEKKAVENEGTANAAFPITVVDALGNEITIEEAPDRIVSLTPSNTEILFELGLEEEIVGVNSIDNYPPAALEKAKVGDMEYNLETIVSLAPDVVFAHESAMFAEEIFEQLEAAGITVFVVDNAETFEETYETIEDIGALTGRTEAAEEIVGNIEEDLAGIQEKLQDVEPRTAFLLVGATPDLYAAGTKTFMDEMLKAIHVENVVTQEGWVKYSAEDFIASNPDTIVLTYNEDEATIKNNEVFSVMTAVQNNALKLVDGDTTSRQGPRLAEGVEEIAKAMYPEVFND